MRFVPADLHGKGCQGLFRGVGGRLFAVPERKQDSEQFFMVDETAVMLELVMVNRVSQFADFRGEAVAIVGKLAALFRNGSFVGLNLAAFDKGSAAHVGSPGRVRDVQLPTSGGLRYAVSRGACRSDRPKPKIGCTSRAVKPVQSVPDVNWLGFNGRPVHYNRMDFARRIVSCRSRDLCR